MIGQPSALLLLALKWESADIDFPPLLCCAASVVYNPVILRLLSFPLLTVAAINGHCFAGGFLLSLACDFRLMREELEGRRAWCCMNEVRHSQGVRQSARWLKTDIQPALLIQIDFGAPLPVCKFQLIA